MTNPLRQGFLNALTGDGAHVAPLVALEKLTAAQVRKRPHPRLATIWEQLAHMVYWQDFLLAQARGGEPPIPKTDGDGWPTMPPTRGAAEAWDELVRRFENGMRAADRIARTKNPTARVMAGSQRTFGGILLTLADHNAYHIGQIVTVRRMLGLWPPPSGGVTW